MRTPQLGPCPSHSQRNWAVLTRLRCEQTIVAQPRVTPAGGVPCRGSQVQKKKKKTLLSVTSNKIMQLTNLIVKNRTEDPIVSKQKLVITGLEDVPLCIQDGLVTELTELKTTHEEADLSL